VVEPVVIEELLEQAPELPDSQTVVAESVPAPAGGPSRKRRWRRKAT
jgi:hypothetical protein